MKIILYSINSKYIHSSLGVWYLYAAAKKTNTNHTVQVLEGTINQPINDLIEAVLIEKPDVIGFSSYIWNIETIHKVASAVKEVYPEIKIFLGGPEASFDAEELIKKQYIDFIISSEGEIPFQKLLLNNFDTQSDEIIIGEMGEYINPYTQEYFDTLNNRICYIETTRGCPFSCAFCLSGRNENVRYFNLEESLDNIVKLANSGTQTVKFVDRTFNCNDKRALEIFKYLVKQHNENKVPKHIVFHFEVEADLFTQDTLDYLKTVPKGLFQFEAGLQSFNVDTLKAVNRRWDISHLVYNLKEIAKGKNIHLHIDLIAGLPNEDFDSFAKGFDLAYEINANVIQLGFLKLLKGSRLELEKEVHEYKYQEFSPYQVLKNKYISYEDLNSLALAEDAVERLLNSQRFKNSLPYILEATNLNPFKLFHSFGKFIKDNDIKNPSLDLYAQKFYEYFIQYENVDKNIFRDKLAQDFITKDKTGRLPAFLQIPDMRLKVISNKLKSGEYSCFKDSELKAKSGKVGICILYTQEQPKVVVADYTNYDSVLEKYDFIIDNLSEFVEIT